MDRVEQQLETRMRGRLVLDGILRDVVGARVDAYQRLQEQQLQEDLAEEAQQEAEEDAKDDTAQSTEAPLVTVNEVSYRDKKCTKVPQKAKPSPPELSRVPCVEN